MARPVTFCALLLPTMSWALPLVQTMSRSPSMSSRLFLSAGLPTVRMTPPVKTTAVSSPGRANDF